MKTRVRTLRGELTVNIPAELAASLNIGRGCEVEVTAADGKLIVQPISEPKYSLDELLARVTDENRHELIDWGPPVGREVW